MSFSIFLRSRGNSRLFTKTEDLPSAIENLFNRPGMENNQRDTVIVRKNGIQVATIEPGDLLARDKILRRAA